MNPTEEQVEAVATYLSESEDTGSLETARRILELAYALTPEPTYEYACFAHELTGAWDSRPDMHMEICPHVVRRIAAGEWEEVS